MRTPDRRRSCRACVFFFLQACPTLLNHPCPDNACKQLHEARRRTAGRGKAWRGEVRRASKR
eukprot:3776720-Alexandrium_andersonii.AAC.1